VQLQRVPAVSFQNKRCAQKQSKTLRNSTIILGAHCIGVQNVCGEGVAALTARLSLAGDHAKLMLIRLTGDNRALRGSFTDTFGQGICRSRYPSALFAHASWQLSSLQWACAATFCKRQVTTAMAASANFSNSWSCVLHVYFAGTPLTGGLSSLDLPTSASCKYPTVDT
jgi:hypothetical protein